MILVGSSAVTAESNDSTTREKRTNHPVTKRFERWEQQHGSVVDVDITQKSAAQYSQEITYEDGTVKSIRNKIKRDTLIFFINGEKYSLSQTEPPNRVNSELEIAGNNGLGPVTSPEKDSNDNRFQKNQETTASQTGSPSSFSDDSLKTSSVTNSEVTPQSVSAGDTLQYTEAEDSQTFGGGDTIGSTVTRAVESDFEGQAAIDATAAGVQATAVDLYVDIEVDSGVDELQVDYDYNYAWAYTVLGSAAAQLAGRGIIRNLDADENLSKIVIFDKSQSFAGANTDSDSGIESDIQSIFSSGNYRVGIRTYVEVDAYGPGTVTASIARIDLERYLNLDSLTINVN